MPSPLRFSAAAILVALLVCQAHTVNAETPSTTTTTPPPIPPAAHPAIPLPDRIEIADGPFRPTVESLKQYQCPEWFRDAKFGI